MVQVLEGITDSLVVGTYFAEQESGKGWFEEVKEKEEEGEEETGSN